MKTEPNEKRGKFAEQDAGEESGSGDTGKDVNGQELDKSGKACKGGGYQMKDGKLTKMAKSLATDDLEKSIARLEEFAQDDGPTRKQSLLEKAQTDELSKSEQDELFELLGGATSDAPTDDGAGEAIVKSFNDSEPLQKAIDVSDYLRENHEALEKSLQTIGEEIEKSDTRRHAFAMMQAKALVDIATLVKSLAQHVDVITDQPARGPKSRGAQPNQLNKSFNGQTPPEHQLTKSDILDTLEDLSKSNEHIGGESVAVALSKYEGSSAISQGMLDAVREHRQKTQVAH